MGILRTLSYSVRSYLLKFPRRYSAEHLAALQARRLRRLLRRAVECSRFYRNKYDGINLDELRLADLPTTGKQELMAHFDEAVTDPAVRRKDLEHFLDNPANLGKWFLGRYAVSHTSGSQGQPMIIIQEEKVLELFFGLQSTRGNTGRSNFLEAARRALHPLRLAIVTLKRGFYPSASAFEYMPRPAQTYVRPLRLSQTDPDVIDRLNEFRPEILTAYAGVLEWLAGEAEAGRLHLSPELRQVTNNSEMLTDRARARIERAFGLRVLDNYATGECPFLSNGCPAGPGAHVNADWAILEVVDEHYRPVPAGKKVLITNLANHAQPFIRYEVGDLVTMAPEGAQPCRCGSRLPRIGHIDGRSSDAFWVRAGNGYRKLLSSVFKQAFDHVREVREWQAVQTDRNRIRLKVELLPGATLDEAKAWKVLNRQLETYDFHDLVEVTLEVVPALPPDPKTGKFKRIVSLGGPPADQSGVSGIKPARVPALAS
jgi:phenylacetate-CoA ligase